MVIIILSNINKISWGITTALLIISGLFFTKKLNFVQFKFKEMFKGFKKSKNEKISPFKTLMLTLGARIGVGSLAGVALAIYIGGPGTIFWMWISTIIVAPNVYVESFLGVLFHEKKNDMYEGGPSYYISRGLNKKWLGNLYAVLVIIAYIFGFLTIQSNTIAKSIEIFLDLKPVVTGIILAVITGIIVFKGKKNIINVCSKIMPFIGILYLGVSILVISINVELLPNVLKTIVIEAFNFKSFGTGFFASFIIGFQRGIFSNEAGIGSGAIAASSVDNDNHKGQGMIQIAGIYFTTLILCTLTALMIMMSNYSSMNLKNINGIEITQYALNYHLGHFGEIILVITIFIFAFSTILSSYYYGESSLKFIKNRLSKLELLILQMGAICLIIIGSISDSSMLWNFVDILIAFMGVINVYSLYKLRNKVK